MRTLNALVGLGAMLTGSVALAQPFPFPTLPSPVPLPGMNGVPSGAPVKFKACPVFVDVGSGCMIAVDPKTGVHFSLFGGVVVPNYVAVITGMYSARSQFCPGVPLDGIKAVKTATPCNSGGLPNKK